MLDDSALREFGRDQYGTRRRPLARARVGAAACGATAYGRRVRHLRSGGAGPSGPRQVRPPAATARPRPRAGGPTSPGPSAPTCLQGRPGQPGQACWAARSWSSTRATTAATSAIPKAINQQGQRADPVEGLRHDRHRPPNDGYTEAAFTWDVSNRLAKILKSRGATVKLTRSSNTERRAVHHPAGRRSATRPRPTRRSRSTATARRPRDHGFHIIMPKKINGPVDPVVKRLQRGWASPCATPSEGHRPPVLHLHRQQGPGLPQRPRRPQPVDRAEDLHRVRQHAKRQGRGQFQVSAFRQKIARRWPTGLAELSRPADRARRLSGPSGGNRRGARRPV